jgi:putrescine transport system permease protein
MDLRLLEAASDSGATRRGSAFWQITVPLSQGRQSSPGRCWCFIPCVGEYVIPELLGGPQTR